MFQQSPVHSKSVYRNRKGLFDKRYNLEKPEDKANFSIDQQKGSLLIIKGSSE